MSNIKLTQKIKENVESPGTYIGQVDIAGNNGCLGNPKSSSEGQKNQLKRHKTPVTTKIKDVNGFYGILKNKKLIQFFRKKEENGLYGIVIKTNSKKENVQKT
jgi:hypothetical protein